MKILNLKYEFKIELSTRHLKRRFVVNCFCWIWKVWLELCEKHSVEKTPSELGQCETAMADLKWDKSRQQEKEGKNQTWICIQRDRMKRGWGGPCLHTLHCKQCLCTPLSAATATLFACWDLANTSVPSVTLWYESMQYSMDTFKFYREIELWFNLGGNDLGRCFLLGNVGLPQQTINMIVLGLMSANTDVADVIGYK